MDQEACRPKQTVPGREYGATPASSCQRGPHGPAEVVHSAYAELLKLETEEETRIMKEPEIAINENLEMDENNEWLRACGWAL